MAQEADPARIERGRRLVTAVAIFFAALALVMSVRDWIVAEAFEPAPLVRLAVTWALLYLVYRGYIWARYLTAILFLLAAAVAGSLLMTEAALWPLLFGAFGAVIFLAGFLVLGFSKSIVHYEREQQRKRGALGPGA